MKLSILTVLLAACAVTASAQTPAKPASDAKPAVADVKPLPHMHPVAGIHKTLYTINLSYQDIKVGAGAEAEPKKFLKFYYTLWLAADGSQIDSTDDRRTPVLDKDRKPVLDENGKPKLGDPQPAIQVMGAGRPLPGWDLGFKGMKAGGKRRIFIPWQLGLGDREIPARDTSHPAIPAKSNLIVEVELLEVMDTPPQPPNRPAMMPGPHPAPAASPKLAAPATPPAAPAAPATPPASPAPPAAAQPQSK